MSEVGCSIFSFVSEFFDSRLGTEMRRKSRRICVVVAFFGTMVAAGAAVTAFELPAAAAAICPSCYGFERALPGVYVEKKLASSDTATLIEAVKEGRQRVVHFWGRQEAAPRILVCSSDGCFQRMRGGGRRGMSIFDFVAVLSPRGADPVIAAHELSMAELNHRIGWLGFIRQAVPVWFNEGIAMYASDDLRYLAPADAANRCRVPCSGALPIGLLEWNRRALTDRHLYAKAACATSRWIAAHGDPEAAVNLVSKVAAGEDFEAAAR